MGAKHGTPAERFWPKVIKGDADACWLWNASISSSGYGCLRVNGVTRTAHTLAWELTNGPIPDGLWVLHRCDVQACCNPTHLFLGTAKDNAQDMGRKGRHPGPGFIGERHPSAKLTDVQVRDIRYRHSTGETQSALGRAFSVTTSQVWNIVHGKQRKMLVAS